MSVEGQEHALKMLSSGKEEASQKHYSSTVKHKSFQILKNNQLTLVCSGIIEKIQDWDKNVQNIAALQHKEEEFLEERGGFQTS